MQKRWSLYLEVCVIDAFKDERWSSGLYSHHRETERGVRESKAVQKNHKQQWKQSRMWLVAVPVTWSFTDLTTPHSVILTVNLLEVNWTQTGCGKTICVTPERQTSSRCCLTESKLSKNSEYNDHFLSPVVYRKLDPKQKEPAWFPPWRLG